MENADVTQWGGESCDAVLPSAPYRCTLDKGHEGNHVAHDLAGVALVEWRP